MLRHTTKLLRFTNDQFAREVFCHWSVVVMLHGRHYNPNIEINRSKKTTKKKRKKFVYYAYAHNSA